MTDLRGPFQPRLGDPAGRALGGQGDGHPLSVSWSPGSEAVAGAKAQGYNTFSVLSPIFAIVVPPAGAVLGHMALAQIRRTRELGRKAAIFGIVAGYVLTAALIAGLIAWLTSDGSAGSAQAVSGDITTIVSAPPSLAPPSVVTSVAPVPITPHVKLDLSTVPVGTCANIEKRDTGDDALDLFAAPCEHKQGVYVVVSRVGDTTDCRSTYVAAPPDHSFAVCLNEF
jgi:hypothetical protein